MEHWGVPKLTWISRRIRYQAWVITSYGMFGVSQNIHLLGEGGVRTILSLFLLSPSQAYGVIVPPCILRSSESIEGDIMKHRWCGWGRRAEER